MRIWIYLSGAVLRGVFLGLMAYIIVLFLLIDMLPPSFFFQTGPLVFLS